MDCIVCHKMHKSWRNRDTVYNSPHWIKIWLGLGSTVHWVGVRVGDRVNPSTHRVHKTWTFLIITHISWYRSRKIKEDSSTEREKFPLRFEPIFITVQCTSRSQDFSNEKWSRNLQIGNAFNDWNSTIFMQIGNVWPKKKKKCEFF